MKEIFVKWIKTAGLNAVRSMAQTAVALLGTAVVLSDVKWLTVVSASAMAGIISVLTSISEIPKLKLECADLAGKSNNSVQISDSDQKMEGRGQTEENNQI